MNSYYIDRYIKSGYELNGRVEDSWKKDISFIEILVMCGRESSVVTWKSLSSTCKCRRRQVFASSS